MLWVLFWCCLVIAQGPSAAGEPNPHNDVRCKCVCPNPSVVNASDSERKIYVKNVPPNECDCVTVVISTLYETHPEDHPIHNFFQLPEAFCPRCVCKYEQRNVGVIRFVVTLVMFVILFLVMRKLRSTYQPQVLETDEMSLRMFESDESGCLLLHGSETNPEIQVRGRSSTGSSAGAGSRDPASGMAVLHRVGNQQDKWKIQVQEQRKNIYDRRTMLN